MLFLVAETILKIHFYNTTPWKTYRNIPKMFEYDQELGFRMISNFKGIKTDPDGIKTEISINQFGLRGLDFSREKKKEYRILVLGDSFTFGDGVNDDETFPFLLQEKFNKAKTDALVINSGVMGYSSYQEYMYLKNKGIEFEPELVVLSFYEGNDFHDNTIISSHFAFDGKIFNRGYYGEFNYKHKFNSFLLFYLENYVLKIYKKEIGNSDILSRTIFILQQIIKLTKSNNIKLMFLYLPSHDRSYWEDEELDYKKNKVIELLKKENILYIDFIDEFEMYEQTKNKDPYDELFHIHLNKDGNKFIAENIYERITSRI